MSKILIIEDEEILRNAYSMILSSAGYCVATAGNGNEGIEQLIGFKPDLILLDMLMPESNGLDFLQRSDINHAYPNTRVILFSIVSEG
jgi:CheY-like chemotaxis protein